MEGSYGPPISFSHLKGATLPGYRAGPFHSSPHSSHTSNISRRSSDGDLTDSKLMREKCRKYESRFWASYRSESPSGESGTIISDPREPLTAWESPDLAPQFSSRPTLTPLAAPASPRPQARRSFNTFPRPWKARSRSPSPFRMKDSLNKGASDSYHFRSFNDSLKQIKHSMNGKRDEAYSDADKFKIMSTTEEDNSKINDASHVRPVHYYTKPAVTTNSNESVKEKSPHVFRSIATISVTKAPDTTNIGSPVSSPIPPRSPRRVKDDDPARKLSNILAALTSRKGDFSKMRAKAQQVAVDEKRKKLGESTFESICDARGMKPRSPTTPQATKFSSSASLLPCVPDEHGSAPLPCDEENSALQRVSNTSPHLSAFTTKERDNEQLAHGRQGTEVVNAKEDSCFEESGAPSGGSGPGDREAPLPDSNAQGLMHSSTRKSVRKKPQIPDKLSKRQCSVEEDVDNNGSPVTRPLLNPSHSFSSGAHSYRAKKASPPTIHTVKSQSASPTRRLTEERNRTTVSQILSTLNFARFRLEELTGALAGSKKDGGKSPSASGGQGIPSRPPRLRHDLEKLRRSTERLKNSDHKGNSELESTQRSSEDLASKAKGKGKSETTSKHLFFSKPSVVRTNSSPAGVSRGHSYSLLSSLSGKLLNSDNKNSDNCSSTSSTSPLPPLSSTKSKLSTQPKNTRFTVSAVSQADLSIPKSSNKICAPAIKLFPAWKENWGSHTLPRCSFLNQSSENSLMCLGSSEEQIPLAISMHNIGSYGSKCDKSEDFKLKSKSEMELRHSDNDNLALSPNLPDFKTNIVGEATDNIEEDSKAEKNIENSGSDGSDGSDKFLETTHQDYSESVGEESCTMMLMKNPDNVFEGQSLYDDYTKCNYNSGDLTESNLSDEGISESMFEKELVEKMSSEDVRSPYKDISIQAEVVPVVESENVKRRNFKGARTKSLDEKREKLRLHIGNKSFDIRADDARCQKRDDFLSPDREIENEVDHKHDYRNDSGVKCRVVETEPRRTQCLVIRSSSFNKSKDGEKTMGEEEPGATSECRVVQTRQRLSLGDSEGESIDRNRKTLSIRSEGSDERAPNDGLFSGIPIESSDSSSQDSVGTHFKAKGTPSVSPLIEAKDYKKGTEGSNNCKRRKKVSDDIDEEDLDNRRSNENLSTGKSTKHLKRQENLENFNRNYDQRRPLKNESSFSDGESRPNSYSEPESLQLVVATSRSTEGRTRKKKNRSDPGFKRNKDEESVSYFSDSNLEAFEEANERQKISDKRSHVSRSAAASHRIMSQASTDSEGRDEFGPFKGTAHDTFRHSRSQTPRFNNPQVVMSGQDSDASYQDISCLGEYVTNRGVSRNTSPSPYLGDSDSGERCIPRSPHTPRRYSKRPLRGPYGEMLEAEMSKSKSSSQFLSDDIFLRPRESNSASPRPSSPASPSAASGEKTQDPFETSPVIYVGNDGSPSRSSPNQVPTSRSLDDSALKLFCSSIAGEQESHLKPLTTMAYSSYESDGEGGVASLPSGPLHQRTASSPSKLFFEPGGATGEGKDPVTFLTSPKSESSSKPTTPPPIEEDEACVTQSEPEDGRSKAKLKPPKVKTERHTKSPKGKKHAEEEPRPHSSLQQPLKKGSHETEFRSHTDHRHTHRRHRDTRAHIIGEIYETEKNYVENLNFLLTRYEQPLRSSDSSSIMESSLVDDIFFQVPEIHDHHKRLLDQLKRRLDFRNATTCVGDVLLHMLKDVTVAESYKSFVNNWKTAQEAAKSSAQAKPAFRHFLVAMAKEHPGKLDLKALLITPVQRFPHYELILKRLLDHTSREHPDYELVKEAIVEVQKVAASINEIEQEALQQEQQQFILKEIENFIEGLGGLVQPERTFLQLELVTQNSGLGIRKERCLFLFSDILIITAIKRRSATIRKNSSLQLPLLSSLESCKLKLFKFISLDDLEIGRSRDDSMKKLVKELESLEQDLQTVSQISQLTKALHFPKGNLEDALHDLDASLRKQLLDRQGADSQLSELELNITTQEGIETLTFMFSSAEKRNKWEEGFNGAKQKLAMSADRRPPPEFMTALPIRKTRAGLQFTCAAPTLGLNAHNLRDVWVCNSDGYVGQVCVMSLQPEPTLACCNGVCNAKILSIASIPAAPHPDTSDDDDEDETSIEEDLRKRRSESLPPEIGVDENDNQQPTMWLGTEDGSIHVYNCNDTIRTKRNKFKFEPGSPVHCIIHIENRVFASLANGDVVVYERDAHGAWNGDKRHMVNLSTAAAPVTRMVVAAGKLWCSATNTIRILNINTLQVEHSFTIGGESAKGVACMVCAGHGVWIAVHSSATIRLHHATTHECVCEVSITSPVTKMLAGCDDIIRQHKLACLKVTALLACKDLLWVGTSAGVIITLPLPHLSHNTRRLQSPLNMVGIPHGHTGNVRFLTSVEMTPESRPSRLKSHSRYSFKGKDHPHHQASTAAPAKLLVISGGDGYEDFRNCGVSEMAGRDDSTNHLLLWQV